MWGDCFLSLFLYLLYHSPGNLSIVFSKIFYFFCSGGLVINTSPRGLCASSRSACRRTLFFVSSICASHTPRLLQEFLCFCMLSMFCSFFFTSLFSFVVAGLFHPACPRIDYFNNAFHSVCSCHCYGYVCSFFHCVCVPVCFPEFAYIEIVLFIFGDFGHFG